MTQRARCLACDKPIRIEAARSWPAADGTVTTFPARFAGYGCAAGDAAPLFCTLRCALRFATLMARAGHRLAGHSGGERPQPEPRA
jgi:hypothetical protein